MAKSWKPEVVADSNDEWCGNAIRFATREEADAYNDDLMRRWSSVRGWRSIELSDPVNYRWEGKLVEVKP